MSIRTLLSTLTGLVLLASFTPAMAFASGCSTSGNYWWNWNHSTSTCTSGNLTVYVQVSNNTTYNNISRVPSDFTVTVANASANPSSFPGSLSGTQVSVQGSYAVNAMQLPGYNPSYSQGCTGNLSNNESATCIVTESNTTPYNTYPYSYYPNQYYPNNYYPYNGYVAPLTCAPSNVTVQVGQSVTFTATGGEFSQFNWANSNIPNSTQYNVGRSFTTTLTSPGVNTITVYNGSQTATCTVNVVGYPIPGYSYGFPGTPGIYPGNVTVTPTYVPSLPNTGFEPIDGAALAFAAVLLIAASFAAYPYVRKAVAIIAR